MLCAATPLAAIDYAGARLDRLLGLADLVVWGTVDSVAAETFTVSVGDSMGEPRPAGSKIEIERYELYDRPGGRAAYEPGQSFVWLLVGGPDTAIVGSPSRWRVAGAEGEGELPAGAGCVYLREGMVPGLFAEERRIHGRRQRVSHLDRESFWDAAAGYRRCVVWSRGSSQQPPTFRTLCSRQELAEYAGRSPLHGHLAAAAGLDGTPPSG